MGWRGYSHHPVTQPRVVPLPPPQISHPFHVTNPRPSSEDAGPCRVFTAVLTPPLSVSPTSLWQCLHPQAFILENPSLPPPTSLFGEDNVISSLHWRMLFYSCRARGHFPDPSSGQCLLHPRTSPSGREQFLIADLQAHTGSPTAAVPTEVSPFSKATAELSRCVFPLPPPAPLVQGESASQQLPLHRLGRGSGGCMRPSPLIPMGSVPGGHQPSGTSTSQCLAATGPSPRRPSLEQPLHSMGSFPGCPLAPGGSWWDESPPGPQHLPLQRCHCQGHPQPQACPEGKSSSMTLLPILPHLCGAPYHSHGARIPSIPHGGGTELCPLQAVTAALFPSPQPHTLTWGGSLCSLWGSSH